MLTQKIVVMVIAAASLKGGPIADSLSTTHGPFVGAVTTSSAAVWARVEGATVAPTLVIHDGTTDAVVAAALGTRAEPDPLIIHWDVKGLEPAKRYRYEVAMADGTPIGGHVGGFINTRPLSDTRSTIAIGSCSAEDVGSQAICAEIERWHPDAVLLLGDTPYIDTTDLATQLKRYGEFLGMGSMQSLLRDRPLYATWDDHDFGKNDTDGRLEGKEKSRRAFLAWHHNPTAGARDQGIYFKFECGPVEVFVLDTRWFSRTERSEQDSEKWGLLGAEQWSWLEKGLKASTKRWKLLACGLVWNSAVRPLKTDFWGMYPEEYARMTQFLGKEQVTGVVLASGDVHNSRILRHPTAATVGYDLIEIVSSPMHAKVHDASLWTPSTWVEASFGHANMMALLSARDDAHGAELRVRFVDAKGEVYCNRVIDSVAAPVSTSSAHWPVLEVPWKCLDIGAESMAAMKEAIGGATALVDSSAGERACVEHGFDSSITEKTLHLVGEWIASPSQRGVIESQLVMSPTTEGETLQLTGYATPEINGHRGSEIPPAEKTWWPLLSRPVTLAHREPGIARAEAMSNPSDVLAWATHTLEGYLAEVNGTVVIRLGNGESLHLAHDGTNELPYSSLARLLVRDGVIAQSEVSLEGIRAIWDRDPNAVRARMNENARHVYWREVSAEAFPPSQTGPKLIPMHSVAVDPSIAPPGAPAILEMTIDGIHRTLLVVCTDRGGAIRGSSRCDLYFGIGVEALRRAGEINGSARLSLLHQRSK
ncbi:MAG: MltA domain-containing protein [Planctomycetota bacterium]|nr:MltA domain-containing protein [Planctomycetota bacterium]